MVASNKQNVCDVGRAELSHDIQMLKWAICNFSIWSGPGVMVKARGYHAKELGSNPTPDILTKCDLFFRKGSKAVDPEMNLPRTKNLINTDKTAPCCAVLIQQ